MEPLEHRTCPTCPGLIAGADPHRLCFQCLGPDHAEDGLNPSPACNACRMIPRLSRRHRRDHFRVKFGPQEEAEDQDLEVVEMGEQDDEVPFMFTFMSRAGPLPGEWALHPEVVKQVWAQFGRAEVDLFASRRNSHCALWFSMALSDDPPLGV